MPAAEYTWLGKTGLKVSRVGLGAWQFSQAWGVTRYEEAREIIRAALESGVNLIDTAIIYGRGMSEEFVGRALRDLGVKSDEVVVASKIPGEMLNYDDVFKAVRRSLERLGRDRIELMQVHWPPCWTNTPTCEYMRALERLVKLGYIEAIGLSDFPVELVEAARACLASEDVQVIQVRFNLVELEAEKEHVPYAEANGMSLLAWSPLAKGAVLGKYSLEDIGKLSDVRAGEPLFHPDNYRQILKVAEAVKEVASKLGKTPAQVALNWLLSYSDVVIPIPGAKNPKQAAENAGAMGWRMPEADWHRLYELARSLRISRVTF